MSEQDELEAALVSASVAPHLVVPLARYGAFVLESNRQFNLTGAKSAAEFAPHLIDSVTVLPYVVEPLIDVGSGAGLPGIPIALATGARVALLESTTKKAAFLERVIERFALAGSVVASRAEIAAHDPQWRERFRSGTARAVSAAPTVAELLLPFLEPGGVAILQRGTMDERERNALTDASTMLGACVESEVALDGNHRIILVRKTASTNTRFPRRIGIPEKRPLCF